ncbi:hypothetical protein [Streptomyces chrestomyceticus]|uniref:Uncharacterized protein n=1 Tax=Streptomyces chrestomyceticus TaxID=68185 RepID=A0ABU7X3Z2_9ACTN
MMTIEPAGGCPLSLDLLFDWLERMPVPEGYKSEVVGGAERSVCGRNGTGTGTTPSRRSSS